MSKVQKTEVEQIPSKKQVRNGIAFHTIGGVGVASGISLAVGLVVAAPMPWLLCGALGVLLVKAALSENDLPSLEDFKKYVSQDIKKTAQRWGLALGTLLPPLSCVLLGATQPAWPHEPKTPIAPSYSDLTKITFECSTTQGRQELAQAFKDARDNKTLVVDSTMLKTIGCRAKALQAKPTL